MGGGHGGYVGGPPGSEGVTRKKSTRARRDPTLYVLNGKRVRTTERICAEVPPPARSLPDDSQFWSRSDRSRTRPSLSFLKAHFLAEGRLKTEQALYILDAATKIFTSEHNMLRVGDGVTVVGDIHGQFYDLIKLFDVGGDPAETPYLFLGDYVDRGAFGIECLLYLYAHKIHYPNSFMMIRGNHECRHLTEYFTFKKECLHKYSHEVYEACIRSFNSLPIAALLDERFLCVHGGIGPDLETLDDFQRISRFKEPDLEGSLCDVLWADPKDDYSRLLPVGFTHNHTRGCSFYYDYIAINRFLNRNNLLSVIRAHEAQDTGYRMYRSTPLNFPSLITIFSAPDYLDAYGNRAAVIKYINRDITIRQFNNVPHPYVLPGHMNAFTWSLPFVGAKITEMLLAILNCCTAEELEESSSDEDEGTAAAESAIRDAYDGKKVRQQEIKNKILAMGRMAKVFELLRFALPSFPLC
ncbi:hypothetical protein M422DRAFT_161755 [Sphaerobolus stellatus SS14]|nr:hypothetical protein M422DRAFT_161755 [Sphaerobolus stellatus SS14]